VDTKHPAETIVNENNNGTAGSIAPALVEVPAAPAWEEGRSSQAEGCSGLEHEKAATESPRPVEAEV
jgi:hypothetical protein